MNTFDAIRILKPHRQRQVCDALLTAHCDPIDREMIDALITVRHAAGLSQNAWWDLLIADVCVMAIKREAARVICELQEVNECSLAASAFVDMNLRIAETSDDPA